MEFSYEALIRHNAPLITPADQEKIRNTRLLIAGCGTGSVLAEAAVRMGFEDLVLVDGDTVELSNINRQSYELNDVGRPKVQALIEKLKKINPDCRITVIEEFVRPSNVRSVVELGDIIVDFIDVISFEDVIALHREARIQKKPVVAPVGVGWGALVIVFTPESVTIEEIFHHYSGVALEDIASADLTVAFQQLLETAPGIPPYVIDSLGFLAALGGLEKAVAEAAQPAIAALTASLLAATPVVRLALGLPVKVAPEVVYFDPWTAFEEPVVHAEVHA